MQINPGGQLATKDVIGRDDEIARYWHVLERQGLVISAERRIGKTHIVWKMRDECRPGYLPFYQDLEDVDSTAALTRSIYETVRQSLHGLPALRAQFAKWSALVPDKVAGVKTFTGGSARWAWFDGAFDDLIGIADDRIILMLWDEFPVMLHNIQRREGADSAIRLLDRLRALRHHHGDRLRFLFTGSIGLHLVLRSLRRAGNTNEPVNDMLSHTVPPMSDVHTSALATALLQQTRAVPAQIPALAARIASEIGGFPYYVHHVVDQLHQLSRPPTLDNVSSAIDNLAYDAKNTADFNHYIDRLSSYYTDEERSLALLVLDTIAAQSSQVPTEELINLCRYKDPFLKDEPLREMLAVLVQDHYIDAKKSASGTVYDFRWHLVKRWWKERRL